MESYGFTLDNNSKVLPTADGGSTGYFMFTLEKQSSAPSQHQQIPLVLSKAVCQVVPIYRLSADNSSQFICSFEAWSYSVSLLTGDE